MKNFVSLTLAATMAAGAVAHSHQHQHQHFHNKKASPVVERAADPAVEWVVDAVETIYELGGEVIDVDKAKEGIENGDFVKVGVSTPTWTPPPPPKPTTTADMGAQFVESDTSKPEPTTSSSPPPPPPPKPKPSPKPKPAPVQDSSMNSAGQGIDSDFPSGQVSCSQFPSDYGALPLKHLGFGGWSGLQKVPDFSSLSSSISTIITGIVGDDCSPQSMCSYACPPGYQKSQFPKAQGSTKQSVGGLFCGSDGKLELTKTNSKKLCEKCPATLTVQNDLNEEVPFCRTDYPGTESMVVPVTAPPGGTGQICLPNQDYYIWDGQPTSAQWYINNPGQSAEEACTWNCDKNHDSCGNWAPAILGGGTAADGNTYVSIFQNAPTSTAKLQFNMEFKGDISSKCAYINGKWIGGSDGCTTTLSPGGKAILRLF